MEKIVKITTEDEYEVALKRLYDIFHSNPNTPEGIELDGLVDIVVAYEQKYHM